MENNYVIIVKKIRELNALVADFKGFEIDDGFTCYVEPVVRP